MLDVTWYCKAFTLVIIFPVAVGGAWSGRRAMAAAFLPVCLTAMVVLVTIKVAVNSNFFLFEARDILN